MIRPTVFAVVVLLCACRGQRSDSDAGRPTCARCDRRLSCDCSHAGFARVPAVPPGALTLDLSFNSIAAVTDGDLTGHEKLRTLSLRANALAEIGPAAFDPLVDLQDLDLSENRLAALNPSWFCPLGSLRHLNLLNNPYSRLGSPPPFGGLLRLRTLALGGPDLEELRRGDLSGVSQLDRLLLDANNLRRYEPGALALLWPLGQVTLKLRGPFQSDAALASAVLADVSYPETPLTVEDVHLSGNESVQPFREAARRRIRHLTFRNLSISDEAIVEFLVATDGVPISDLSFEGITLTGEGRWERASWTDHRGMDRFLARDVVVLDVFQFVSFLELRFLLRYPRAVSAINCGVFLMPCPTSRLLVSLQYLDLSDNLLTDLTLEETLCGSEETLPDLRVLNVSGNALKSLSTVSRLVAKLSKLTHLDISRTGYSAMPPRCPWPPALRHLNISRTKFTAVTACLPATLEVLDLSHNNLGAFTLPLPALSELHLSGNKLLRLPAGALFPNLQTLTIQSNTLNVFAQADLQSYRRLEDLQAAHNKFICSCDFVAFFQAGLGGAGGGGGVRLTDREDDYVCDSPLRLQGEPVSRVRLSVLECRRVLFVSLSCGVALLAGLLASVLLWRLHAFWYLKMTWAWLRAKRRSRRRKQRRAVAGSEPLLTFDAFVSYSERDAGWVEQFLVPELEEPSAAAHGMPRPLTLCLHKRDFLPGRWIVDNIMSAMERSRRTVFVLSESFVRSDWCRYELDFSHFWLFDGSAGGQAAILILLEPLSKDDVPKRFCKLRKLMSSTTYLEWPQEEGRRAEFWSSLRDSLRAEQDP